MALNNLGLGFVFTAKDLAGKTVTGLERKFDKLEGTTDAAAKRTKEGFAQIGVGLAAVAVGTKALGALFDTTTDAREFGKAIAEVSTLTDEATFSTESMRKVTQDLAVEFGRLPAEQARGLYQAISGGATTAAEATEVLRVSNKLAVAGVAELDDVTKLMSVSLNNFGEQGLTAEQASDQLFTTVRIGITNVSDLSATLGKVLGAAKGSGVSFTQLNAAMAVATQTMGGAFKASTGLTQILQTITKPSDESRKAAKKFGIEMSLSALKTKGLVGFLDDLREKTGGSDIALRKIFTTQESFNAVVALGTDNGKALNDALADMENAGGATDEAFKKMSNTLDFQIKQYEALKKSVRIAIGEALAPAIGLMVQAGGGLLRLFKSLPQPMQRIIAIAAAMTAGLIVLTGAYVALRGAVRLMGPAFIEMMGKMSLALIPFIKFIVIAALVIAAVLLVKKAWDENIGGFRDTMLEVWAEIEPALLELKDALLEAGRAILDALAPAMPVIRLLGKILLKVAVFQIKVLLFHVRWLAKVLGFLIRVIAEFVRAIVTVFGFLRDLAVAVFKDIVSEISTAWDWLQNLLAPAVDAVSDVFVDASDTIKAAWSAILSVIGFVTDAISRAIAFVADKIEFVIDKARRAKKFLDDVRDVLPGGEAGKKGLVVEYPDGTRTTIKNPESLSPGDRAQLGIGPAPARQTTNFAAAGVSSGGAIAGGGTPEIKSVVQANIVLEVEGEAIAKAVRRVEAQDQTRRSQ